MNPIIVGVHSFRGGTGRTTSVVATCAALYAAGKRVLACDMDLEAPGLTMLRPFSAALEGRDGSLGVLERALGGAQDLGASPVEFGPQGSGSRGALPMEPPLDRACFNVLPSGWGPGYGRRLRAFNGRLHREDCARSAWVASLKAALLDARDERDQLPFEFVILDLRAGLSELSMRLALEVCDHVVMLSTFGTQSVAGTHAMMRLLDKSQVSLCMSMVPHGELELRHAREEAVAALLEGIQPSTLPHHPRMNLDDSLHTLWDDASLVSAYEAIADHLVVQAGLGVDKLMSEISTHEAQGETARCVEKLSQVAAYNHEYAMGLLREASPVSVPIEHTRLYLMAWLKLRPPAGLREQVRFADSLYSALVLVTLRLRPDVPSDDALLALRGCERLIALPHSKAERPQIERGIARVHVLNYELEDAELEDAEDGVLLERLKGALGDLLNSDLKTSKFNNSARRAVGLAHLARVLRRVEERRPGALRDHPPSCVVEEMEAELERAKSLGGDPARAERWAETCFISLGVSVSEGPLRRRLLHQAEALNSKNFDPNNGGCHYNKAIIWAHQGRLEEALEALRLAITKYAKARENARVDDDLRPLRAAPGWDALIHAERRANGNF